MEGHIETQCLINLLVCEMSMVVSQGATKKKNKKRDGWLKLSESGEWLTKI